jgi:nucleoid DNA-binding protein
MANYTDIKNTLADTLKDIVTKDEIDIVLKQYFFLIAAELNIGNTVHANGFGTFYVAKRERRNGRNPKTGSTILIPDKNVIKFVPSPKMQQSIQ